MKYFLSFLILFFIFAAPSSCSEDENSFLIIDQVSGVLYENKSYQDVMLEFSRIDINPSSHKK